MTMKRKIITPNGAKRTFYMKNCDHAILMKIAKKESLSKSGTVSLCLAYYAEKEGYLK